MFSYLGPYMYLINWFLYLQELLLHFISKLSDFFRITSHFRQKVSVANTSPNDLKSTIPSDNPESPSTCEPHTVHFQLQHDLTPIGLEDSGQVYNVSDQVILKSCRIFVPPSSDASQRDLWRYAADTLFHLNLLKDERTIFQLLQNQPHPHIMKAIDTDQPEGLYLRKYRQLPADMKPTQARRIRLYRDIADALRHLHSLGIVHGNVKLENVLFDDQLSAVLCDFSTASPCGQSNPVFPDLPLSINGPSSILSEKSDMFALASLMFHMEHGFTPELSLQDGRLALPELESGDQNVDEIMQKAWLGNYSCTSNMVHHLASIDAQINQHAESIEVSPDLEDLKNQVKDWKNYREQKFGCVLEGILPEEQLKALAKRYNMDPDTELRFSNYCLPS